MTSREDFVCQIERGLKRHRTEIQKLYPKIPRVAYFIVDRKLRLPNRIFEHTETFRTPPGGIEKPPYTTARFDWSGRNGSVITRFDCDSARYYYEPSRMRQHHWIAAEGDLNGLPRLLHWLECEFASSQSLGYFEYIR